MNEQKEAVIVLTKCSKNHKTYGIRAEKLGRDHWSFTWAFPLKEESARHEGYDKTSIKGTIEIDHEYPGCPFCGTSKIVLCDCGHLSCNHAVEGKITCPWCGMQGTIGAYKGSRISAGIDA